MYVYHNKFWQHKESLPRVEKPSYSIERRQLRKTLLNDWQSRKGMCFKVGQKVEKVLSKEGSCDKHSVLLKEADEELD